MESNPNPIIFFWIAAYSDGSALPQFDPESGEENLFKSIDQTRLIKFGWYPFSQKFALKLSERGMLVASKQLPRFEIELKKDQRLIAVRRGYIKRFSYHHCTKCGHSWLYDKNSPGITTTITQNDKPVTYKSPQCPSCEVINRYVCPDCKLAISKNAKGEFFCTGCQKRYPKPIKRLEDEERKTVYLLGWQQTIEGRNYKSILFIDEDGNVEVSDEFNK